MIKNLQTEFYELHVLTDDQKDFLARYGPSVESSDGVVPNVYGVWNKDTEVYEYYCANMPQAMAILTALQEGINAERDKFEPKKESNLRSI